VRSEKEVKESRHVAARRQRLTLRRFMHSTADIIKALRLFTITTYHSTITKYFTSNSAFASQCIHNNLQRPENLLERGSPYYLRIYGLSFLLVHTTLAIPPPGGHDSEIEVSQLQGLLSKEDLGAQRRSPGIGSSVLSTAAWIFFPFLKCGAVS
jgi:hypothetical protein